MKEKQFYNENEQKRINEKSNPPAMLGRME